MAKKQSAVKAAQEAINLAEELFADVKKNQKGWEQMWNQLCGIGGEVGRLFPDREDREVFLRSPEWAKISELMATLPGSGKAPDASGMLTLRVPKSLHAGLVQEAEAEGVSLNQLCMAKLAMQLKALV